MNYDLEIFLCLVVFPILLKGISRGIIGRWKEKPETSQKILNPFVPSAPFLYPLKTVRFSDIFRG